MEPPPIDGFLEGDLVLSARTGRSQLYMARHLAASGVPHGRSDPLD